MAFELEINGRKIGPGHPCFIIAETGVNHNGSLELAKKLVDVAKKAGADAVKFQTFIAEEIASELADKAEYQKKNDKRFKNQLEMLKTLELTDNQFSELSKYCADLSITFLSTPFDLQSVELLEKLNVPAYKIASGELTNVPLLKAVAGKHKPVILSTGMSTLDEVANAIKRLQDFGSNGIAILHCTTNYPSSLDSLNLRAINTLELNFKLPVGFSDHSKGIVAPPVAVALGACIIEKHFTLDQNMEGPDHKASLEPKELLAMVEAIRNTEKMLGTGKKEPTPDEQQIKLVARKSLFAKTDIKAGQSIHANMVQVKRPLIGIPAEDYESVIGKTAKRKIFNGFPILWSDLE